MSGLFLCRRQPRPRAQLQGNTFARYTEPGAKRLYDLARMLNSKAILSLRSQFRNVCAASAVNRRPAMLNADCALHTVAELE